MNSGEETLRNKRITVNVNDYCFEVIDKLQGHCGNSSSSVVYYMIRNWIIDNSKKIVDSFKINLSKIKNKYITNLREVTTEKDLDEYKKNIIKKLPQLLRKVSSINVIKFEEHLGINAGIIEELFLYHSEDIEDITGLDLILKDEIIINKSI